MDKSFVRAGEDGRFEVHDLIRQYAEEKLAEDPAAAREARDRHRAYYAAMLSAPPFSAVSVTREALKSLTALAADLDNLRAWWRWSLD